MPKLSPLAERLIAAALGLAALILVVQFFEHLPIEGTALAIDWNSIYHGMENGGVRYDTGLRNPPWSVLFILPLGLLSFRASWGVLTLATLAVEVISVPSTIPRWKPWVGIALLVASFPSLRHVADGNLEALIIGGTLLILHGFAARNLWTLALGILLATTKTQETWMLMLVLGYYLLQVWPAREWLRAVGIVLAVVVPSLIWKGAEWWASAAGIEQRGSIMDASLIAAFERAGLPSWATISAWLILFLVTALLVFRTPPQLSREKAALLIAVSLLLSPYSAGNSYLTVLAIGVIPLLFAQPVPGIILLVFTNALFFAPREWMIEYSAYYATALLALTWGMLGWRVWETNRNDN
jgi:hypothetical protein